jgi:hypothetical protein
MKVFFSTPRLSSGGGSTTAAPNNIIPQTVAYTSPLIVSATASQELFRCILTGAVTIGSPTAPTDGARIGFWLSASGITCNVGVTGSIVIPTSSSFSSPYALAIGKKVKLLLEYDAVKNGGQWELTSFIPGY